MVGEFYSGSDTVRHAVDARRIETESVKHDLGYSAARLVHVLLICRKYTVRLLLQGVRHCKQDAVLLFRQCVAYAAIQLWLL